VTKGYCYKSGTGKLDLATLSPELRAVQVNALVTRFTILPMNNWTDKDVQNVFNDAVEVQDPEGKVVEVEVCEV